MASMRAPSLFLLETSALTSSTLLVKCSSTTCKMSVIAFFADDLSRLLIAAPRQHTSDQEAADKQAWSLLPARASVLNARSLLASNQDSPIYKNVFVRSSERGAGGTRVHACRWHAGRTLRLLPLFYLPQPFQSIMHPTLRAGYAVTA